MNDRNNPAAAIPGEQPSRRPGRRRHILRWMFFVLGGIVVLIALFYAEEDLRGRRAWEKFKQQGETKGEKYDLAALAPPPVPDEQNFAMTPLLQPIFDYVHGTNGVRWRDTNAYAHLFTILFGSASRDGRVPAMGSLEKDSFTDLSAWQNFFLGNTNYPQPSGSANASETIRTALGKFNPEFQELQTAAKTRPYSRFPIDYDQEPPAAILLPHLTFIKGFASALALQTVASLESGRTDQAAGDLKLGFYLSDCIRDEPILINHLVRIAIMGIDLQVLREGLIRHAWTDAQLAEFEKYLASVNLLSEYKRAIRGECAMAVGDVLWLRRQGFKLSDVSGFSGSEENSSPPSLSSIYAPFNLMPSGWSYQNMLTMSRLYQEFMLPSVDETNRHVYPEMASDFDRVLGQRTTPYNLFAKLLLPALAKAVERSARMQTFVDEARVACALERYRLAKGQLPEKLDALTPQFIDKIPVDLFDGQPLRYRRNRDGGYVIYSIGWNQTDDEGEIVWRKGKTPSMDLDQGDWVWKNF